MRLAALLHALAVQEGFEDATLDVVVVLNNCTDGTISEVDRVRELRPELALTVVEIEFSDERAHVGEARRLAMDTAAALAGHHGAILTTDADAVPPRDWVSETLRAFALGADLVGGRLVADAEEEAAFGPDFLRRARAICRYHDLCDELAALVDPIAHDPWPRHHDHTGASLAVRADVYRRLGGLDPLPSREDLAFVSRARAAGFRLRHPPSVGLTVSARTDGRARGGMADCLKAWRREEATGAPILVEPPEAVERRLFRRARLRELPDMRPDERRAALAELGIDPQNAHGLSPAALIELYASDEPDAPATALASEAIAIIVDRIAALRGDLDAA